MRAFDGISKHRARPRRSISAAPEPVVERSSPPRRRGGSGLLLLLMLAGGAFLLARPAPSVDGETKSAQVEPAIEASSAAHPAQFRLPQGGGVDAPLESLTVLEKPTEFSAPQEDAPSSARGNTSETSRVSLRILNGSGKSGAAATLRDTLANTFTVQEVGNARSSYATTTLYYQTGQEAAAEAVSAALGKPTPILEENPIAAPAQVLIVLGNDRP